MMLRFIGRMWMGALASLALVGAAPAWADEGLEEAYISRGELSDSVLRGVVGVATVRVGPGMPWVLPRFEPQGEGFRPTGEVVLVRTNAISGWTHEDSALRRYPVTARRGDFLQLVIDVHTGEQAWIQDQSLSGPLPTVLFHSFDGEGLGGSGIDLELLLPVGEQVTLYEAPSPSAREVRGVTEDVLNDASSLRLLRSEGDFVLIGADRGFTEEAQPLGWVRLRDPRGVLRLWPLWSSGC